MPGIMTLDYIGDTSNKEIAYTLGGGIRENSLVIMEGESRTGKSVLCQHIAYGILQATDSSVAYFSTEYNSDTMSVQMTSMSLEARYDLVTDRIRVSKMGTPSILMDMKKSLQLVIDHILALPPRFKLIILDSPSAYMIHLNPMVKMDFLEACKEICERNKSIVLTLDSHVMENSIRKRTYDMSDYYLNLKSPDLILKTGQIITRTLRSLEVTKLAGAERHNLEPYHFEIKPRIGIQILPFTKIRV